MKFYSHILMMMFILMWVCCGKGGNHGIFDEGYLCEKLERVGFKSVGGPAQTVYVEHESGRVEKKCFEVSKTQHVLKICMQKFPDPEAAIDAGSQLGMNLWTGDKRTAAFIRDSILVATYGDQDSEDDLKLVHQTLLQL